MLSIINIFYEYPLSMNLIVISNLTEYIIAITPIMVFKLTRAELKSLEKIRTQLLSLKSNKIQTIQTDSFELAHFNNSTFLFYDVL
jgi:hypothetical protein